MREVILAKSAGFCFGVKRAVDTVYEAVNNNSNGKKVYTYGPIIHNEEVVDDLTKKGVTIVNTIEELKQHERGIMVIRAHGVGKAVYDAIEECGYEIIDATCPFVKKIHGIVSDEKNSEKDIIIVGGRNHPEVCGIMGWCKTEPTVIDFIENAQNFLPKATKNALLVAQTTFNSIKFKELVEFFRKKYYNVSVYNTICNATHDRQAEAAELASSVDAMIVVGGAKSSNTQKLYEISKKQCVNTYYIQTLVDLDLTAIESAKRVGITAGASTPNNIIKEVHDACQN